LQLEASLTLGEIAAAGSNDAGRRAGLRQLQAAAQAKGFGLIARKAAVLAAQPISASATGT
jgi:hypothetical protein